MKRTTIHLAALAGFVMFALTAPAVAADKANAKEVTITGDAMCAKCELHQGGECQTVIQVDDQGKKVNYYVTANDVSKPFHENICHGPQKATATGMVSKKDGKLQFAATKIELVK